MRTFLIGGARPNFMKISALARAYDKYKMDYEIIHTGQHYDYNMSKVFFDQLELKDPLYHLDVGEALQSAQTGRMMEKLEQVFLDDRPDLVFTVGDVNSTLAASLVAAKLKIPLAHQEAGCREFDKRIPEEVNRIVADILADYLFANTKQDYNNLLKEGIEEEKILLAGDVMIDNLLYFSKRMPCDAPSQFCLVTIHRPENVDNKEVLRNLLRALEYITLFTRVVFPMHPRTRKMVDQFEFWEYLRHVDVLEPLGYFDFLCYMKNADCVITDSDGIQVETSVLDVPCITVKNTTNFPFTVEQGTNILVGYNEPKIIEYTYDYTKNKIEKHSNFDSTFKVLLNGGAAERIVNWIGKQ